MPITLTPAQLNRRAELYHQLGSMITAGVPLIKSLEMVSVRSGIRNSRKTFLELISHLQGGETFTDSMKKVHGWLPDFDIALLSVGEKSGRLDASFKMLGLYYTSQAIIIRDTITGLLMTIVTFHLFLLIFPIGMLQDFARGIVNNDYSLCLPFIIEKIVAFVSFYGIIFLLVYACQGRHGLAWRSFLESVTNYIPVLRTARKYLALSRLSAALGALLNAGTSIVTGWELAARTSGSPRLHAKVSTWLPSLESGATPAELVGQTDYFPVLFANLYNTGEQSGKLDETLQRLQVYYQEEGFRLLRMFSRILNGIIYGAIAILVGINVILFWKHYYEGILNSTAGF